MLRFKARIACNSWLLQRFATQKLGILDARCEFMSRLEDPEFLILVYWDVAKVVKARGFDPRIRRFESCRPSH